MTPPRTSESSSREPSTADATDRAKRGPETYVACWALMVLMFLGCWYLLQR